MKKKHYSLSIHITTLFLVLTALMGAALIYVSYSHTQAMLDSTFQKLEEQNSQALESTFYQQVSPVLTALDFMVSRPFVEPDSQTIADNVVLAPFAELFQSQQGVLSVYVGDKFGNFTLIAPVNSPQMKKYFSAPRGAQYVIQRSQPGHVSSKTFYSGNLSLLETVTSEKVSQYDPRNRPWYQLALKSTGANLTEPYKFYGLDELGITFSKRSYDYSFVVGADYSLNSISDAIESLKSHEESKVALVDAQGRIIGQAGIWEDSQASNSIKTIKDLSEYPIFSNIEVQLSSGAKNSVTLVNGNTWALSSTKVELGENVTLMLLEAISEDTVFADALAMRDRQIWVVSTTLFLGFALVWFVGIRLATPLKNLVALSENIARFDFKKTRYPKTVMKEVSDLTDSMELMEHTLHDLLRLLREATSNQDFNVLAKTITHQSYLVTRAETIKLFVHSGEQQEFITAANHAIIPFKIEINQFLRETAWLSDDLKKGQIVHLNRTDNALSKHLDYLYNSDVYLFPLLNREQRLVGILLLGYEREITKEQSDKHAFLKELLSFAEIAKENIDRMQQQKDMLNAFIELIASSIDTKSPYTGSHCQRVPVLTQLLTEAAESDNQYYPLFAMNELEWEELKLASWLHDCGKVTTPEYVIDKATKLETIYDRIHEIRMRFELLKVTEEKEHWQRVSEGEEEACSYNHMMNKLRQLDEDFEFVAQCNLGSEFMEDKDQQRLQQIASYQWRRTLDDQLGVSWVEKERASDPVELPTMEPLISDKPVHFVQWDSSENPKAMWQEEFVLQPKALKYNRGELYNLSIQKGTLNDEERFIINDHIIQTINMLNRLPYPEHLKNTPDIAGGHHERVDGKGYPRGLNEDELTIPARAMAIADVFEALTSTDRPYKKAKKLSECIHIMTNMATTGHVDPKLYLLFLERDIYAVYAERFLEPSQIDFVDSEEHIKIVKNYIRSLF